MRRLRPSRRRPRSCSPSSHACDRVALAGHHLDPPEPALVVVREHAQAELVRLALQLGAEGGHGTRVEQVERGSLIPGPDAFHRVDEALVERLARRRLELVRHVWVQHHLVRPKLDERVELGGQPAQISQPWPHDRTEPWAGDLKRFYRRQLLVCHSQQLGARRAAEQRAGGAGGGIAAPGVRRVQGGRRQGHRWRLRLGRLLR
mmetsp:Transcript_22386/g.72352  ORF Transcript_22386/g.72352 Transcript_22386/m.72352 type:complete len:204 (+) Transcript_22386:661-1272(+)|eukprot:scaffold15439_cov95-Isochrysis_galbana.AAC.5